MQRLILRRVASDSDIFQDSFSNSYMVESCSKHIKTIHVVKSDCITADSNALLSQVLRIVALVTIVATILEIYLPIYQYIYWLPALLMATVYGRYYCLDKMYSKLVIHEYYENC